MSAQIKASYFAGTINALDVLGPAMATEARARLAPQIAALHAASRAEWLPIAYDDAVSDVVCELGGVQAIRDVNRRSFLLSIESPLIRPFFQGAVKLIGMSPRAGLRFFSKGWDAGIRGAGTFTVAFEGDAVGVLTHTGYSASRNWYESVVGIIDGIYEATLHVGTVDLSIDSGTALFRCRWQPGPR